MACVEWQDKLSTYADGELSPEQMRVTGEHLRECPSCTADLLARVQMKRAIQGAGKRFSPSIELRRRIEKGLPAKQKRAPVWNWMTALITTSVFLLAASVMVSQLGNAQRSRAFGELADIHVSTLASATPVDVVSTDRHTVKPWFQGKIPFAFNIPELGGTPFTLEGGRMAYLEQSPGAQLIFNIGNHRISVFIFQDEAGHHLWSGDSHSRNLTFDIETWSAGNLRYFLVGDADPNDIQKLSELLKAAAKS